MRLQKYLTEEFFDGIQYASDYIEIYKNPSKRDLRTIPSDNGYRFFIDLKNKNFYVFTAELFHMGILDRSDKLKKELNMNWQKYWNGNDKTNSYIIMGDAQSLMRHFSSDVLYSLSYGEANPTTIKNIRKLLSYDYKWLKKYGLDPDEVESFVDDRYIEAIDRYEGVA